jgi:hypothetical protein
MLSVNACVPRSSWLAACGSVYSAVVLADNEAEALRREVTL